MPTKETEPEVKTQVDLLISSLDVLDGDKDYVKRFGPALVYLLGVTYAVLLMSGFELPNVVHALASVVATAGGWFARHTVSK